ncbi:MAG: 50S ribosomal protein L10 [Bacteroidales bacterium]
MKKEEKNVIIDRLVEQFRKYPNFYLADISTLNAENTTSLRRLCFEKQVSLIVVKNTLLQKALERDSFAETAIFDVLKGATAIMFSAGAANVPAKLIKEFRTQSDRPILKAAYVQESLYIGDGMLEELANIKSREELIADVLALLQSPAKTVLSALQSSSSGKISGLLKSLESRVV